MRNGPVAVDFPPAGWIASRWMEVRSKHSPDTRPMIESRARLTKHVAPCGAHAEATIAPVVDSLPLAPREPVRIVFWLCECRASLDLRQQRAGYLPSSDAILARFSRRRSRSSGLLVAGAGLDLSILEPPLDARRTAVADGVKTNAEVAVP